MTDIGSLLSERIDRHIAEQHSDQNQKSPLKQKPRKRLSLPLFLLGILALQRLDPGRSLGVCVFQSSFVKSIGVSFTYLIYTAPRNHSSQRGDSRGWM